MNSPKASPTGVSVDVAAVHEALAELVEKVGEKTIELQPGDELFDGVVIPKPTAALHKQTRSDTL